MKNRLALAALALLLATGADARALFVRTVPFNANYVTGLARIEEAVIGTANTLGGNYAVADLWTMPEGSTETLRRGAWYKNGIGASADSAVFGLIVILGDDTNGYVNVVTNTGAETSVGGFSTLHTTTAQGFQWFKPGMVVTGTPITGSAVIIGIDSLYQRMRVRGTVTGGANFTVTWRMPARPDSLTLSTMYPRVPILRFAQFMGTTSAMTTSTRCSTGVGATSTYAAHQDSTRNIYEVGNTYRSWKARMWYAASATRDPRGWRPIMGSTMTREATPGHADGNYDFVDAGYASSAFSDNPDTVSLWLIQNRDAAGALLGGDAAPNIYCLPAHVNGTNSLDPGSIMVALNLADSLSGGALFGDSKKLPRQMAFHIDDGWKRGDSRFAGSYGGIGVDDTTAFKASIDSLASLQVPFVVGVELDSLDSVLLATDVTGNGIYYDQRWWAAAAPWVHYTPHCHAGLATGTNRSQNTGTIGAAYTGKFIRPLDLWGLTRTRYAFGSTDSALAGLGTDYHNDIADTASAYWLNKRAFALADSAFGSAKVDRLVMPPGDDWTVTSIKHTRLRQHGLGLDSVIVAAVASGATGIRVNSKINVVGNDDSTVTNNYGYYPTWRRLKVPLASGGAGSPSWIPASLYGRPCELLPTNGYPSGTGTSGLASSVASWSHDRASFGGEQFLCGLLFRHVDTSADPTAGGRDVFVLSSHCSDFGSSGRSNEETRPMFYTFKYVTNAIRVANAHGLRDLVQIVYPDQVHP